MQSVPRPRHPVTVTLSPIQYGVLGLRFDHQWVQLDTSALLMWAQELAKFGIIQ
jgi:hypothetical protein